jgi:hypothetical protein
MRVSWRWNCLNVEKLYTKHQGWIDGAREPTAESGILEEEKEIESIKAQPKNTITV